MTVGSAQAMLKRVPRPSAAIGFLLLFAGLSALFHGRKADWIRLDPLLAAIDRWGMVANPATARDSGSR